MDESARTGNCFAIGGKDRNHICNVLRMQVGDTVLISCGEKLVEGSGKLLERMHSETK